MYTAEMPPSLLYKVALKSSHDPAAGLDHGIIQPIGLATGSSLV